MADERFWRIWVDTGGTFTDCLAVGPDGRLRRAKVLSTSALRGRLVSRTAADRVTVTGSWQVPAGFFRGFSLHPLGADRPGVGIAESSTDGELVLSGPVAGDLEPGAACELRSPEEAPLLAARLVTGTPGGNALPPIRLRLATTRGTNAVLERRGAPTALFITAGFGDLLEIGTQQRPDLFALQVIKPAPLYAAVAEVPERLSADGSVVCALDEPAVAAAACRLVAGGIRSAAVALLHSYRNPVHERAVAAILRREGFTHVSSSAELAPLIRLLPRAETAVVDAYLAPVLEVYLDAVAAGLAAGASGGGSLHVMTSAGGLVGRAAFHPKDALLSGPAGGVVGAAAAGRKSGFSRLIAFDMGGTSTDVSRFDGDFEYAFEHRVADAHLVAPALAIESVAAGGGSVCGADGPQLRVGPQSAGARPGPACYGAGGPLTLTDVNLLLGRLVPGRFEIPLDPAAAGQAVSEVALLLAAAGAAPAARESLLVGWLAIANERMAEAVRRISVRKGFDPAAHALVAFGGAGAQHACALAELLGMATVVVPADAGLLSALGLGQAVIERFVERQVLRPLAEVGSELAALFEELGAAAGSAVVAEGVPVEETHVRRRLLGMRLEGQDTTLEVEYSPELDLPAAFAAAYQRLYGYAPPARAVEVESARAVASSQPPAEPIVASPGRPAHASHHAEPTAHQEAWFAGGWQRVGVFERHRLETGARGSGPCLVVEDHSATVVEAGWAFERDGAAALVLRRANTPC